MGRKVLFTAAVISIFTFNVSAQMDIAGFFDFLQGFRLDQYENENLRYGQAEINFTQTFNDKIYAELTYAFNTDDNFVEIGAAFVDVLLYDREIDQPGSSGFINSYGFSVGQIDVPFGLDYNYIPSPDRESITIPVTVEKTINNLNTLGATAYANAGIFDITLIGINSYEGDGAGLGGRLGLVPAEFIEFGGSVLGDMTGFKYINSRTYGADVKLSYDNFELRSEYILADGMLDGELDTLGTGNSHSGIYVMLLADLSTYLKLPVYAAARYGTWQSELDRDMSGSDDNINRFIFTGGYVFNSHMQLRIEFFSEQYENADRVNRITGQIVYAF